ncbi:MAG: 2-iminoacetate synthase ThiH [Bacteroidales bacterium]
MPTFSDIYNKYNWEEIRQRIHAKTSRDVELALSKNRRDLEDFISLISPAAIPYIEQMAQMSNRLTIKRFGKTIQMYIPLYLSNECSNSCKYCGYNITNKIERITLSEEQILKEMQVLKSFGFDHVLLVTGESKKKVGMEYFKNVIKLIKPYFALISMEVQPLEQAEYESLIAGGLNSVYIYQETYNKDSYRFYHPEGDKADFYYRLETPDRLGEARIYKIGLGVLLGLEDWRTDSFFVALHLNYLEKKFWQSKYSISLPRLRPAVGIIEPRVNISDKELVQLICAYRLFDEEVEISLSTRESEKFRTNVVKLGITSMSAGSKTNPGGYAEGKKSLEQFVIADERDPNQIAEIIRKQGYEVIWKDWDKTLQSSINS